VPGEPGKPLAEEDQQLLQAIAGHASVALENARLFTRMEQANRHWIEIFDAIGDLLWRTMNRITFCASTGRLRILSACSRRS